MKHLIAYDFPFARNQLIGVAIFGYLALTISYVIGWNNLPWDPDIEWNERFGDYKQHVLYALEFLTITSLVLYCVWYQFAKPANVRDQNPATYWTEKSLMLIAGLLVFVHAGYSVYTQNHNLAVRLGYALFCWCVLILWLRRFRAIYELHFPVVSKSLEQIDESPELVFSLGRRLSRNASIVALSIVALILPIFMWLPTLVPSSLNPYLIAGCLGAVVATASIGIPVYVHYRLSRALYTSLNSVDKYIENHLADTDKTVDNAASLKDLLGLRQELIKSLKLPGTMLVVITVQVLTVLGALVGILNGILGK